MAIVANIGNINEPVDTPWCTYNRSGGADPNGSITPEYVGEIYLDTGTKALWVAVGAANTGWVQYQQGPR